MPLDPDLATLIEQFPAFDPTLSAPEARANGDARRPPQSGDQRVVATDLELPRPGGTVRARHYAPPEGNPDRGLLVFFHGGGFVLGDLESHDGVCRDLAAGAGVALLAIDYRLAPEHPYPAAVEDAWAAFTWAREHAGELGADPANLAVGGDSAGGNLSAVVALMARDEGVPIRLQLLVYPVTDLRHPYRSFEENGEGYFLSKAAMQWFEGHYHADVTDWRASPLLAPDHSGVAPAVVLTCEYDPLRDEGDEYAARLATAGVPVTHRSFAGLTHGSLGMSAAAPAAGVLMNECTAALRGALRGGIG